jgi:ribosomal protein L40E
VASLDRIRTDGFRRWYERQLIDCHAWLVSWFLGLIVFVSGIEVAGGGAGSRSSGALLALGGLAVTWFSWKRYHLLLEIAERLGEQAVCPKCEAYGKFKVLSSGPAPLPDGGDPALENHGGGLWLHVQCRKCGGEWTLK